MSDVIITPEEESQNQKYWNLFVNRDDAYAVQQLNGSYASKGIKLTHDILFGEQTIGLYQLNKENKVKWAVIDFDINKKVAKDDPNFDFAQWDELLKQQVQEASKLLKEINVPHYIEFSGFRGYHIWIFFNEAVDASLVKPWMHKLFHSLPKVHESLEWELFPKQEKLTADGYGNLVKLPLQVHLKSGKTTYFVDDDFNKLDGLPEVELYELDPVEVKAITETTKHAPKSFNAADKTVKVDTKYPVPDSIAKMLANCAQLNEIVEKAETINHLENDERVVLANLGRFFGDDGIKWIHSVLKHCRDYDPNTTGYHITMLSGNPVYCQTVKKIRSGNSHCDDCKIKGNSPLSFGYTRIQQHYFAGLELIKSNKLPDLFSKLGLTVSEKPNYYEVELNNYKYHIDKQTGGWLKRFNIIDFIRFARPDDWSLFIHQNFPEINVDRFAVELTDKKIDEIFPYKGVTVNFNKYLSEANKEVEQILTDDNNYNMIAFTGSGKTEAVIKKIQDKKLKAIFLTPYESTSKQLENKYKVPGVYGSVNLTDVKNYVNSNSLIVSTYDGLRKILDTQIVPEEYILLIDEAHNLVSHSNFRRYALQTIFDNMRRFKKIINISGTPEGVLNNDYKNIKFEKLALQKQISNYKIFVTHEETNTACVEHIINNPVRGKIIIFKNSIDSLNIIKDALIERGVKKRSIRILHANAKEENLYVSIVEEEEIPSEIKYVLTTSVISDGVNIINQNIEAVYLLDCQNLLLLRQFVARFRKGVKSIFDFIPFPKNSSGSKKWFDFPVELKSIGSLYEKIALEKTKFLNESGLVINTAKTNLLSNAAGNVNNELDFLRVNEDTGQSVVNYPLLTLDLLNAFNAIAFIDIEKRKEYLDYFLNVNCTSEEVLKTRIDLTASKEKVREKAEKERTHLIGLLKKDAVKTITAYLQNVNQNLLKRLKGKIVDLYDANIPTSDFYNKNKRNLKLKESARLIEKYMLFHRYGFPHDFIISLLNKSDNDIHDFELGYYTQLNFHLIKNHKTILKYNKKSNQVFHYALFKFIYDYFENNKEFTFDKLHYDLNTYLISQGITYRKLEKGKLIEITNRMIKKTRLSERKGKKSIKTGWKFEGFTTVEDLVGKTNAHIIDESIQKHLKAKLDFMELNLFIGNLDRGQKSDPALRKEITDMRKSLEELTKKPTP